MSAPDVDRAEAAGAPTGVVIELCGERRFVPSALALEVAESPLVTRVPGSELGLAVVSGRVVAVVALAEQGPHALVCELGGDAVAFSGVCVLRAGFFEPAADGVWLDGREVRTLDLGAELQRATRATLSAGKEAS